MKMSVLQASYDGKEFYYSDVCGYDCYFHKDLVKEVRNDYTTKILYIVEYPLTGCNIVESEGKLAIMHGNYNLFLFQYGDDGKIEEVESAIKIFDMKDGNCALIFSDKDKIKVKWSNDDGQHTTLVYNDGRRVDVPSEEILKYL